MQPIATITRHEAIDHDELAVRNWRVSQLKRCGIPGRWPAAGETGTRLVRNCGDVTPSADLSPRGIDRHVHRRFLATGDRGEPR
jgi:hypothetical protein